MGTKTDAGVKLAIVFFISLLSFSIGTFVGKKYSDNQHTLASLEPSKSAGHVEREVASTSAPTVEPKTGVMTDEEIAKLAEEFVTDETTPSTTSADLPGRDIKNEEVAHENPAPANSAVATPKDEPSSAAKNLSAGNAPTQAPEKAKTLVKENRLPSSLPKDVAQYTVGKFTVQVASYTDEVEAQKLASNLKSTGYSAFYVPANVKGKTYYRVSIGQFASSKEAQSYRADLLGKGKVSSAIVQKISE